MGLRGTRWMLQRCWRMRKRWPRKRTKRPVARRLRLATLSRSPRPRRRFVWASGSGRKFARSLVVATVHTELVNLEDLPVGKLIAFQVANVYGIGVSKQTQIVAKLCNALENAARGQPPLVVALIVHRRQLLHKAWTPTNSVGVPSGFLPIPKDLSRSGGLRLGPVFAIRFLSAGRANHNASRAHIMCVGLRGGHLRFVL